MTIKRILCLVAALLLVPAVAAADDLSATLTGGGGSGIASIQTGSGSVSYAILTHGIGNVTGADVRQGNSVVVDLNPPGGSASVAGSVSTVADLAAINQNPSAFTVRVVGTGGTISGPLANAGAGPVDPGDDEPGTLALAEVAFTVSEVDGQVVFSITRTGGSDGVVSVAYTTVDGTATAGSDFTAASGTVSFADGDAATKTVPVTLLDDGDADDGESFTFVLSDPTGGADLGASTATVTLLDDDTPCIPDATTLCLRDGRFEVRAVSDPSNFPGGQAQKLELTDDTGLFYFFNDQNIELVVKVLDACVDPFNRFWVFAGGLTDVEVEITVRDSETGFRKMYTNDSGVPFQPVQDTNAFATCP